MRGWGEEGAGHGHADCKCRLSGLGLGHRAFIAFLRQLRLKCNCAEQDLARLGVARVAALAAPPALFEGYCCAPLPLPLPQSSRPSLRTGRG